MRAPPKNGTFNPEHVKAMFKNFSPTTAFGWLRFFVCLALCGHVLVTMFLHGIYFIDARYCIAMGSIYALFDKLLGAIQGHFTADSPPGPKEGE